LRQNLNAAFAQTGLKLMILLPPPPPPWNFRHGSPTWLGSHISLVSRIMQLTHEMPINTYKEDKQ
jgi:hypothetical protein